MRFAIWAGSYTYWGRVHPDNLTKADGNQMGGSEAAALSIATALARQGHYVLFGSQVVRPSTAVGGNLRLCPLQAFGDIVLFESYDVAVSWDEMWMFRMNLHHIPVKVLCYQLNDTRLGVLDYAVDLYFHPSKWHATRFVEEYGVPEEKQRVGLTNGLDPVLFAGGQFKKKEHSAIWASSPDRGLHHLLRIWPRVLEEVPDAVLDIYYDMDKWLRIVTTELQKGRHLNTTDRALEIRRLLALLPTDSARYHGGVSKLEVLAAMALAKVYAYPCDPVAPTEGFSMTTLEAWASGCAVLITDADALQELWGDRLNVVSLPLPIDDDLWTAQLVGALQGESLTKPEVPQELTWDYIAAQWVKEIENVRNQTQT